MLVCTHNLLMHTIAAFGFVDFEDPENAETAMKEVDRMVNYPSLSILHVFMLL